MIEWGLEMRSMSGTFGHIGQNVGMCLGIVVLHDFHSSKRGKFEQAFRIKGEETLYPTEDAIEEECKRRMEGRHGTHYLEVARLRTLLMDNGIDPESTERKDYLD